MSNGSEVLWSKKWINNFKQQCAERGIYAKCIKIHGHDAQERGISDYLICYEGKFIALEFKARNGSLTSYQDNFLQEVYHSGGVSITGWVTKTYFHLQVVPYDVMGIQLYGTEKTAMDQLLKVA